MRAAPAASFAGCTHLECTATGERHESEELWTVSRAGAPLYARYDLAALRGRFTPDAVAGRPPDLWRYAEVLPVRSPGAALRLGEGMTPMVPAARLAAALGLELDLYLKDEGQNPTASFKARGLCVAVSRAAELGARAVALPSAGNAASAAAAYAAAAGIECHVVMPRDTPAPIVAECRALGAFVDLMDGLITDCAVRVKEGVAAHGWFDLSTLREPYRVEGKKTMGYELVEQLAGRLPDVIIYPTGGGTGLVGMWKAFDEMEALGWIDARRPRMVSVQADGCAPIVDAWRRGLDKADPWPDAHTIASGLRVPRAIGDFLMLRAIRASGGAAIAVSDAAMIEATALIGRTTGLFVAPEAAATAAALPELASSGAVRPGDQVVLFATGSGLKYVA
ncbi:MAG TPA: threonine synthase [Kofleriaceae bacterium]|nr:threonine synthase [Kofleriaceae bacterium]